jgi:hypothetical protein
MRRLRLSLGLDDKKLNGRNKIVTRFYAPQAH